VATKCQELNPEFSLNCHSVIFVDVGKRELHINLIYLHFLAQGLASGKNSINLAIHSSLHFLTVMIHPTLFIHESHSRNIVEQLAFGSRYALFEIVLR
jgi:hypothetical protein